MWHAPWLTLSPVATSLVGSSFESYCRERLCFVSKRRKRPESKNLNRCYICEKKRLCELAHLIPARREGSETVPLCISCHDMADRVPFEFWDERERWLGFQSVWENLTVEARLWLFKVMPIIGD